MRVLLVEDDPMIGDSLRQGLRAEGFAVDWVQEGRAAEQALDIHPYALVLLDLGLPKKDGLAVLSDWRRRGITLPVLILTARDAISDRVRGLDSGADDYLVKPFDVRELSARIRSLLRRPKGLLPTELMLKGVQLELETRTVKVGPQNVHLMPKQCALLEYLMRHPNRPFGAKALLDAVWPSDSEASEDTVRTCMKTLRRQLATVGKEDFIKTVLGSGYLIEDK